MVTNKTTLFATKVKYSKFRDNVKMNTHHCFLVGMVALCGGSKRSSFLELHVLIPKINFLSYMRESRQLPSLSAGKDVQKDSWDKSSCGAGCSLCGLGQRQSHWNQSQALMMCSEPVEACKSAAGISFCVPSIPPQPLRYCQSYFWAHVSSSSVKMRLGRQNRRIYRWTEVPIASHY